jgi:hypothetical protein
MLFKFHKQGMEYQKLICQDNSNKHVGNYRIYMDFLFESIQMRVRAIGCIYSNRIKLTSHLHTQAIEKKKPKEQKSKRAKFSLNTLK